MSHGNNYGYKSSDVSRLYHWCLGMEKEILFLIEVGLWKIKAPLGVGYR